MTIFRGYIWKKIKSRIQRDQAGKGASNRWAEEMAQTLQRSGLAGWKYDAQKDCFCCSKEFARIFGLDNRDTKTGLTNLLMIVHPDDRLKALDAVARCLEGEEMQVECRISQCNGGNKFIRIEGTPIWGEDQRPVGMIGTARSVTGKEVSAEIKARVFYG